MCVAELLLIEQKTRVALTRLADMVQAQHLLQKGDPLRYSYDQMTVLFDRLDAARAAHDAAYTAWSEVA